MHAIKIILIALVFAVIVWSFRNRRRVGLRAGARLLAILLAAFAIASIINTNIPQAAANAVGVTRGTDLILYALVLIFVVSTAGLYFRSRELERRMVEMVRASAIRDAVLYTGLPVSTPNEPPTRPDETSSS